MKPSRIAGVLGQTADLVVTYAALTLGYGPEGNPIAVWAMSILGVGGGLIALKIPVIAVLCWEKIPLRGGILCAFGLAGAALWIPLFFGYQP